MAMLSLGSVTLDELGRLAALESRQTGRKLYLPGRADAQRARRQEEVGFSEEVRMSWRERIVSDAHTLHGKARVQGTRIPVSVVLDNLAVGLSYAEILASYPSLTEEDIRACLAYAAALANERLVDLRTGTNG